MLRSISRRLYHSAEFPQQSSTGAGLEKLLSAGLKQVPEHGFTQQALLQGCREAGLSPAACEALPYRGSFDLVLYHLETERNKLKIHTTSTTGDNLRHLVIQRLRGNIPYLSRYPQALDQLSKPRHLKRGLEELHLLSNEIWYLCGDSSTDLEWYTKRMALSAIYVSSELYMIQDRSREFAATWEFVDKRIREAQTAKDAKTNITQWLGFNATALGNIIRSKM